VSANRGAGRGPARRLAVGVVANVVALGVLAELTGVVDAETLERTVAARVPRQRELNLRGPPGKPSPSRGSSRLPSWPTSLPPPASTRARW